MSKGSDINVGSIEENIEIIKNSWLYNDEQNVKFVNAIEHLLQDYTRQKQINEEHQKINGELREKVNELERENRKLRIARIENAHGYENIHFVTKNDLVSIDTNKHFIEIEEGTFVDLKQIYLDNKNSIPKQKIKDKTEEIKEEYELLLEHQSGKESNRTKYLRGKIHMGQELLQESEDK